MRKESQISLPNNPQYVASRIKQIIDVMVGKMSLEAQYRAYPNISARVQSLNPHELSMKKSPGGASIGMSISLVKNILNGKDPFFIKLVMDELSKQLGAR